MKGRHIVMFSVLIALGVVLLLQGGTLRLDPATAENTKPIGSTAGETTEETTEATTEATTEPTQTETEPPPLEMGPPYYIKLNV